ncbi:unnamed protein product, partial [Discosporangium mesarthrocarpum]
RVGWSRLKGSRGMSRDSVSLAVHACKFADWMPSAVHALATEPSGRVVAVGREHGDIELTVPFEGYRVEARIPGQRDRNLRSLVWSNVYEDNREPEQARPSTGARLFGCGMEGAVFEVDLVRLCYKNVRNTHGGAAWNMKAAASLPLLAVGCEDGTVKLFSTSDQGLEYKKSFLTTNSRVLSVTWGTGDEVVFAGCANSLVHCFDASTGQSMFDMRLEGPKHKNTSVWALEALKDGTVISGDSMGRIQIWDQMTGTQLQSLVTHQADVRALCTSGDGSNLFCSGMDGKVVCLDRGADSDGPDPTGTSWDEERGEWSVGTMQRRHTHDVFALALHPGTGGDG